MSKKKEYKLIIQQLLNTPSQIYNEKWCRVHYVRYADYFIIGIEGSLTITKKILDRVSGFITEVLKLKLKDKAGIKKFYEKPIKLLGYSIIAQHLKDTYKSIETIMMKGKKITTISKIRIIIFMDHLKILKHLETIGFIRSRTDHKNHSSWVYRGRFKGNLINLDHADIISYYNAVIRDIYNYYDFVENRDKLR